MDPKLKDKAAQPIQSLSERWSEDPAELLPVAIATTAGLSLLITFIAILFVGRAALDLTVWRAAVIFAVAAAVLALPMLAFANSLCNGEIETARKKVAKAEARASAQQEAERERFDEVVRTLRLPLLEWAVQNDATDKITGLDQVLARAVDQAHIRPLQERHQALITRIRRSGSPSLADGA